jgi:hypothetical protein
MTRLWTTLGLSVAVAAVYVSWSAAARPDGPYYVDQNKMSVTLEAKGFAYNHQHVPVSSALCRGRSRFGFRMSEIGSGLYWRFTCDAVAADDHYYTLQISSTYGPSNYWYWHVLSARLEY